MVLKRIITGVALGIFAAVIIWLGDPWFTAAVCIAAALGTFEFYRIVRHEQVQPLVYPGIFFTILFVLQVHSPFPLTCELLFVLIILLPLLWMLFKQEKDNAFINVGWTIMGVLYIGWLMSFYVNIRSLQNGMGWAFLVLGCTALCDVFAYAVGSRLGKHALLSSVSPGKTVEGAVGGMAASIIFAVVIGLLVNLPLNYWQLAIAGVIIGSFAQIGDLVESLLKRNMKAKDAGNILPGHGGILDRIDSHLLVAPVAYFLILLITKQG
jgi:phosphatidate cytidylyltransferase